MIATSTSRITKTGHRPNGATTQLLDKHVPAQTAQHAQTRLAANKRPSLGAVGSSSSLTTRRLGASDAMRPISSAVIQTPSVWQVRDHHVQLRRSLRHAQVVTTSASSFGRANGGAEHH